MLEQAELCDDGNSVSGDGCDSDCQLERVGRCLQCAEQFCIEELDDLERARSRGATADALMACAFASDWALGNSAPPGSCGGINRTTECACGKVGDSQCASVGGGDFDELAASVLIGGQCWAQSVAGVADPGLTPQDCRELQQDSSLENGEFAACVLSRLEERSLATGAVNLLLRCERNNCAQACFPALTL